MQKERTYKIVAFAIALLLHIGVALLMLWSVLTYDPSAAQQPTPAQPLQSDITFGGEYVALGDIPVPNLDGEAAAAPSEKAETPAADDIADAGEKGEGSSLVSTTHESAMKTPTKQNGPTKEELEAQARAKKEEERQKNESKKIDSSVKGAFGKGSGKGTSGSKDGNASHGALSGRPGHTLGVGYTLSEWGRPSSGYDGEIVIRVRVNAKGKVIQASYSKGSGAAAANQQVRQSCIQASLNSRFSVPKNSTGEKVGTIIWRFE